MDILHSIPTNSGDWINKFGELWQGQLTKLREKFSTAIEKTLFPGQDYVDVPVVFVKKPRLVEVLQFLKSEPGFEYHFLSDLTATDEQPQTPRFEVVYNLFSTSRHSRIRVKVTAEEGEEVPTVVGVWKAANWAEREVWDMYGVRFAGHPDLRRILMDQRWVGHPLRKDYPLRGYQSFTTPEPIDPKLLE